MKRVARVLWAVEMFRDGAWKPMLFPRLSRKSGRYELNVFRRTAPTRKFRLAKYLPAPPVKRKAGAR